MSGLKSTKLSTLISKTTLQPILLNLTKFLKKLILRHVQDLLPNLQKKPSSGKMFSHQQSCQENWQIAEEDEEMGQNCILWKETQHDDQQNNDVMQNSKPFYH